MTPDGHLQAARELQSARVRLRVPDDVRLYVEATVGAAMHLVSYGLDRHHGSHVDRHEGMVRVLRERGHSDVADAMAQLERFRLGRWYGRQGNGDTTAACDRLLDVIEPWAVG